MRTDIERFFCTPPSGNCCNAEIRRRVCGCDFPRQTPSFGTAGISLTKHRINAILIHGRRARYVRFCRSGFSAAQSGKRSGAGLRRDVEAAFLTRPAIIQFLDKMVCSRCYLRYLQEIDIVRHISPDFARSVIRLCE